MLKKIKTGNSIEEMEFGIDLSVAEQGLDVQLVLLTLNNFLFNQP